MNTKAKGNRAERRCMRGHVLDGLMRNGLPYCLTCNREKAALFRLRRGPAVRTQPRLRVYPPIHYGCENSTWKGGTPEWVCERCGQVFHAYHKQSGRPRRFCSWQCANVYRGREGGNDMRARYAFEYEAIRIMVDRGYSCLRSAGSRGPVDVFAFSPVDVRFIQVKTTKRPYHRGTLSMLANAAEELREMPHPPNTSRWLMMKVLRGPWIELCIDEWPLLRSEMKETLKCELLQALAVAPLAAAAVDVVEVLR